MRIAVKAKKYNKPQINADEGAQSHASGGRVHVLLRNTWARRRGQASFRVHSRLINHITPQMSQRTQSLSAKRNGTRMTRIRRIFTDTFNLCASVSSVKSVFYLIDAVSAFICVHLRLIINKKSEIND